MQSIGTQNLELHWRISLDKKYFKVESFLDKELCNILSGGVLIRERNIDRKENESLRSDTNGSFAAYANSFIESLMFYVRPEVERLTGYDLIPTYSFVTVYNDYDYLPKHTDRPSCEISVTVTLRKGDDWPIFVEGTPISLEVGDAVIYKGREVEHWREKSKNVFLVQAFLHYVIKDGEYHEYKYDRREKIFDPFAL